MALKAELQEIVDDLEFDSDEEKVAFEKFLEKDKIGGKIQAGYMKNKDYTTKTAAVAEARRALEAEQTKWNEEQDSYMGTLNTYKTDMEKRLNTALAEVSKSRLYGAALETKLSTLAAQYGEDVDTLMADVKDMRTVAKEEKATPAYDDEEFKKRYVPRDEFSSTAEAVLNYAPMIRDIDREYHRLYGKEYEGSMSELIREGSKEVQSRRARGQQIDVYGWIREKLDFDGQKARNGEAAKTQAEADRKKWEEDRAKEIEVRVRSEYLASNPGAARKPEETDQWRRGLDAKSRQTRNAEPRPKSPQDTFKRQQEIHRAFEEQSAKGEGRAA